MRGFANSQINTLYNGIKIGPPNMTSRVMDSGNLERIEFLKGPASLMSGEGSIGGAGNMVTRMPESGPIRSEARLSGGSFNTVRAGVGSGGSTALNGLDYRFDLGASRSGGFIDDSASRNWHFSAALDQRLSAALRLWGAVERKTDRAATHWGTPLVSRSSAAANASDGLIDGSYVSNFNGTDLGPVTIDKRTLRTNYNVLDSRTRADHPAIREQHMARLSRTSALMGRGASLLVLTWLPGTRLTGSRVSSQCLVMVMSALRISAPRSSLIIRLPVRVSSARRRWV